MTVAITTLVAKPTFDCGGAQLRAHCRPLATVVTISGEIDAGNLDLVSTHLRRFLLEPGPVVLDMSEVSHCTAAAVSLFHTMDAAAVEWALVASPAIIELLGEAADDDASKALFPMTCSVHQALSNLADAIVRRRQQLLPLIKKTA